MTNSIKTIRMTTVIALVLLVLVAFDISASAQKAGPDFRIGNKGEVHFNVSVIAGGTLLQPGMYQLQHQVEGADHVVIFKEVAMPAGYRHSNTPVGKEAVARIKCRVEAVDKKVNNTKIQLRTNSNGEKEVAEVQIAGEAFKHIF